MMLSVFYDYQLNGIGQDCSNSSASADVLELPQSCTKPLIYKCCCVSRSHMWSPWHLYSVGMYIVRNAGSERWWVHTQLAIGFQEPYVIPLTSVQCLNVHCEECWLRTLVSTHTQLATGFQEPYVIPLTSVKCWHVHCEECWLRTLVSTHTISYRFPGALCDPPDICTMLACTLWGMLAQNAGEYTHN